jgi:hypothetical protein
MTAQRHVLEIFDKFGFMRKGQKFEARVIGANSYLVHESGRIYRQNELDLYLVGSYNYPQVTQGRNMTVKWETGRIANWFSDEIPFGVIAL